MLHKDYHHRSLVEKKKILVVDLKGLDAKTNWGAKECSVMKYGCNEAVLWITKMYSYELHDVACENEGVRHFKDF
jgi:hypothetical protein